MSRPAAERQKALLSGLPQYFTGKPCKFGHVSERATRTGNCIECNRIASLAHYAAHPDRRKESRLKYESANKPLIRSLKACWRRSVRMATPPWADQCAIRAVYAEAERLSVTTGIPHEVDHVAPLRGRTAWGLHVHWNLRAIPADENRRKSNQMGVAR